MTPAVGTSFGNWCHDFGDPLYGQTQVQQNLSCTIAQVALSKWWVGFSISPRVYRAQVKRIFLRCIIKRKNILTMYVHIYFYESKTSRLSNARIYPLFKATKLSIRCYLKLGLSWRLSKIRVNPFNYPMKSRKTETFFQYSCNIRPFLGLSRAGISWAKQSCKYHINNSNCWSIRSASNIAISY